MSQMDQNQFHLDWLFKQKHRILIFTGCGISFAMADMLANLFRNFGFSSFALQPAEIPFGSDYLVCLISRSGRTYGLKGIDFLFCERDLRDTAQSSNQHLFLVRSSEDAWLPLSFCKNLFLELSSLLNISMKDFSQFQFSYSDNNLFLTQNYHRSVQYFCDYTHQKIDAFNTKVIGVDEFGHGFHQQLLVDGSKYETFLIKSQHQDTSKLEQWLRLNAIAYEVILLEGNPVGNELIFETMAFVVSYIDNWCKHFQIDWVRIPISKELDNLR